MMINMFLRKFGDSFRGHLMLILAFVLGIVVISIAISDIDQRNLNLAQENQEVQEKVEFQERRIGILLFNLEQLVEENDKLNREIELLKEENEAIIKEIDGNSHNSEQSTNEKFVESSYDINILARIIHAEARGESMKGKIAVGNVVLNRVKSDGFPNTIEEVVYQPGQFQPVTNGSINQTPNADSVEAAKRVLNGEKVVGDEIIYFYNPATATDSWIFTRTVITTIGNHAFAK